MYGTRQYNAPSRFISEMDPLYLHFGNNKPKQPIYEKRPYVKNITSEPRKTLVGKMVKHTDYGTGVIIEEGTGILTIAFGSRGIKKIAKDFVEIL